MITRFTSKCLHLLGYSLGISGVGPLFPGRPRPILISGFISRLWIKAWKPTE